MDEEPEEDNGEEADCGGVFMIGCVDCKSCFEGKTNWKIQKQNTPVVDEQNNPEEKWKTKKTRNQRKNISRAANGKQCKPIEAVSGTRGRYGVLAEEVVEEADICAVESTPQEEITIDSGAGRNVWPRTRKEGGKVEKLARGVKLMAANGQEMKVDGEKVVKFTTNERQCGIKFLVTDVKKPLAAVSAIVDEDNVVVFGPGPWGSFIQNAQTGERIPMERKKWTYVIRVEYPGAKAKVEAPKDDGGRKEMDVGAVEKATVFRGQI